MSGSSLFAELKRRNVIRMAGLYLVGAWLITQVVDTIFPMFGAPDWLMRSIVIVLAIGFVPALVFAWVFAFTPDGFKLDAVVAAADSIGSRTAQRMNLAIVAVLLLALTYFGVDKFVFSPQREATLQLEAEKQGAARATERVAGKAVAAIPAKSIAVLPLVNGSGDKDQQYFSDGLSEDLITALSQFDGLKVIGRNSAFQFRNSKDSSKVIGAKLGVAHLLEGSVRRAGDTVRITAQLVEAADGSTLWSQHFDRPFKDLFALQDEITSAVASALKAQLLTGPDAAMQSDHPPSGNMDAYTAYLQGKFYRTRGTQADLRKAIDAYTTATRIDPRYAQAYAMISHAWTDLATQFLGGTPAQQAYAQARAAATSALALNPDLAAVHVARGRLLSTADFNWAQAETEYRRAVQLAPNDGDVKFSLGVLLATLGNPGQAVDLTRQALAADPLHASWYYWLATYLAPVGRLDEAEQAIRKAIELQPEAAVYYEQLAVIEILRGNAKAALISAGQEPAGVWHDIALALALQIGDDREAADAALQALVDAQADVAAYQIADVYALRNDADKVFEWLDRAWVNRDPGVAYLLYDPFILRYRDDPRFSAFARKIGLPMPGATSASMGSGH
ncbi:tetratricopeptide repeat protein [Lysobacter sp. A289]